MNDSKKPVDLVDIDRRFTKGIDLALGLIFPAATLAWPGMKKVWGYIKKTVIGKKINQVRIGLYYNQFSYDDNRR